MVLYKEIHHLTMQNLTVSVLKISQELKSIKHFIQEVVHLSRKTKQPKVLSRQIQSKIKTIGLHLRYTVCTDMSKLKSRR